MTGMLLYHVDCYAVTCDNGRYVVIACWLLCSDMWQWPVCCYSMLIVMQWHVTMAGMLL